MKAHRPSARPSTIGRIGRKAAAHRSTRLGLSSQGAPATRSGSSRPAGTRLAVVGQLDSKNRLSLPKAVRDAIHVGPGDSVFLNVDDAHGDVPTVRIVKAVNPLATMLDALAAEALREYHAGETISLREVAARYGVDLDAPETDDDGRE